MLRCREGQPGKPAGEVRKAPRPAPDGEDGGILACARCRSPVTTTAARVSVGGAHAHSFVNPHGISFRIGCFTKATGCVALGPPSSYWTWFPLYSWQMEQCAACREHLGWLFRSADHQFHGLILDRLVELDEGR